MISASWAPGATDVAAVGGKASSLFRLLELGARVPPFFVLTTDAHRAHAGATLSASARVAVVEALGTIGSGGRFAVRSSGVAEDSSDHSFAGVFETLLDVSGEDGVIAAIETCWTSHRGERAALYRADRGVGSDDAMAVIVQQMVDAEWSGVCFTADPVARALSVAVVNAVEGAGEALVSGLVTPEEIRVDRDTRAILGRQRPAGAAPCPDAIVEAVAAASLDVAERVGFPQDLEWAYAKGELFLLQSRPITTIAAVFHNRTLEPTPDPGFDASDRIWTRAYADEVWTPPISPLFYDVQNLTHHLQSRLALDGDDAGLPASLFKYYRAAPYADTDVLARVYRNLPPVARRPALLVQLPSDKAATVAAAPLRLGPLLRRFWKFEILNRRRRSLAGTHRFLERSWDDFVVAAERLAALDPSTLDESAIDAHIADIWSLALLVGVECEVAVLYHAHDLRLLLTGLLDRWFGAGEELYAAVSAGLPGSHTVRESDELWQIAETVRNAGPEVARLAGRSSLNDLVLSGEAAAGPIVAAVEAFLRRHRHRGANYKDLIHPRWGDDPELLWNQIRSLIAVPGERPRQANASAAVRREQAQAAALGRLRGWRAIYRKPLLRRLFRYNEIYSSLRDNHRFYYDYIWWLLRRAYREIGTRLATAGQLRGADDVFFLARGEIDRMRRRAGADDPIEERITIRRAEWEATRRDQPPRFLRGGYAAFLDQAPSTDRDRLKGVPASPGQVRGRARIAYEIADLDALGAGDVLVTRQTDPAWTTAFSRLSGLVLETGGALAHGASLCREFGLPCVTAVEQATALIQDGDLLLVSGDEGTVDILDRAEPVPAPAKPSMAS